MRRLRWWIVLATMLGYSVGNLPDHGLVWSGIKLAFTVVLLILTVLIARQEARRAA